MNRRAWQTVAVLLLFAGCGPAGSINPKDPDGGDPLNPTPEDLNKCPSGTSTTLTGVVLAPNGIDPVPGAIVFVPDGTLHDFPAGASCDVCRSTTDAALVSALTRADGTFTIGPLPTEANAVPGFQVPIVAQKGRFRKAMTVSISRPCEDNHGDFRFPSKSDPGGQDRVPKIAVATGSYDAMECVMLGMGLDSSAVEIYDGKNSGSGPKFDTLLKDPAKMKSYNIIFVDCGSAFEGQLSDPIVRANVEAYVTAGGRLYVTDQAYDFVEQVFPAAIDFQPSDSNADPETMNAAQKGTGGITVQAEVLDNGLAEWLRAVQTKTGENLISATNTVHVEDFLGSWAMQRTVATTAPSMTRLKPWLRGTVAGSTVPSGVMPLTTTFDYKQCGRVLYSSYHTRGGTPAGTFPAVCGGATALNAQERVLEYLILHVADCIVVSKD